MIEMYTRIFRRLCTGMSLDQLRSSIEDTDRTLVRLIAERMNIARQIALEKERHGLPVRIPERAESVLSGVAEESRRQGLDPVPVREIFAILIRMSEDMQTSRREEGE
ncbi:MAG: chorismate mutase [Methanospirillum sp.]|nr:chorismate mutase [Methanospirillum sp.]